MATFLGTIIMVGAFLLAAPIIESGTSISTQFFQAIASADGGGGGY